MATEKPTLEEFSFVYHRQFRGASFLADLKIVNRLPTNMDNFEQENIYEMLLYMNCRQKIFYMTNNL